MDQTKTKQFNLEQRTFQFAQHYRDFTKQLPKTAQNYEYISQLIRSSGSVAANYIEANESLSKKDFVLRIKICRKEAKESQLWLNLSESENTNTGTQKTQTMLVQEAGELTKIFSAIAEKSKV